MKRHMTVDSKVYALAEGFIDDMIDTSEIPLPADKAPLIQRAAEAMQQAIEDECEAIRRELQG